MFLYPEMCFGVTSTVTATHSLQTAQQLSWRKEMF